LLFNREGDCLKGQAAFQQRRQHLEDWEELLLREIERQQPQGNEVVFRADAAFAKPQLYEALEEPLVEYTIRLPVNEQSAAEHH